MTPSLPTEHHDCRMWNKGKDKRPQGITIIYGEDKEMMEDW